MASDQTLPTPASLGPTVPTVKAPSRMAGWIIPAILLLLAVLFGIAQFSPTALIGFKDAATVLAIIAATSVGIERLLEGFWTVIGVSYGSWWPPVAMSKRMQAAMEDLNATIGPTSHQVDTLLQDLEKNGKLTADQVGAARKHLEVLQNGITNLKGQAPNSPQTQAIVTSISQSIDKLQRLSPEVDTTVSLANQSISVLADFAGTFKNNPARQLISLYLGVLLGLLVSTVFGLDLLQAAFGGTSATGTSSGLLPHLGVAITGLVMGLGSNPTHEIIRAIQEYKNNLKSKS